MALVEALACGVPVVAPAAGGPKEITDDSCAKLYRPGDAHAAAAALIAALEQRDSLATAARARAERHFDIRHSRSRYAELFPQRATATAPDTKLAIVTVLHNSETEIAALVASIDRHLPGARLIAVDSASTDNGAEQVRDGTVIRLDENVGYGRGTNIGIERVTEPVTVILNPDVELLDSSLAAIAEEAEKHPDRILAPLVLLPDGRRQDNVHPPGENLPGIQRPWQANEPKRVGWAVGCALVARTDTLRKLGPFDPTAFLYGEDLELGLRAREQGIETWFWPHARVLHHRAHSTAHAFDGEPFELLAERRRAVIEQRRGTKARRKDDVVQGATFASRIAAKALLRRPNDREKRQLRALLKVSRRDPPTR
jgi:GT2 family glycosyltransferase